MRGAASLSHVYNTGIMRLDQSYFNENTMMRENKEGIVFRNQVNKRELIVERRLHENP